VTGYTLDDYIGKVVVIHEGADKVACGIITAAPALKVELNLFGLGNDDFTYHIHEGGSWILQKQHWSAMVISNPDLSTLYLFVSLCFSLFLFVSLCFSLFLFVSLCVSLFLLVSLCVSLCLFVSLCVSLFLFVSLCVSLCLFISVLFQALAPHRRTIRSMGIGTIPRRCKWILGTQYR
jgi:hypothetical protein